jgi:hypothetical protein
MNFPLYAFLDLIILLAALLLWIPLWKRLDRQSRIAAIFTFISLCILSACFQYLCLVRVNAWCIHPENTWLLPITILNSPFEEYLFWWGFALIMLAAYLWPCTLVKRKKIKEII